MIHRIVISQHERAFLFRDGTFRRFLEPGVHWVFEPFGRVEVKRASLLDPRLTLPEIELLVQDPEVAEHVDTYRITDTQRGLLFRGANFEGFLEPGFHVILKTPTPRAVEIVDINEFEVRASLRPIVQRSAKWSQYITMIEVPEGHLGQLYADHVPVRHLEPGRYFFWNGLVQTRMVGVDLREQALEIQGQELMTQDKVSLRVNLTVRYQVVDAPKALSTQANFRDSLYRALQLALRDEIGGRTLDDLLARKEDVGQKVVDRVHPEALAAGVSLLGAGLRDLILPGDMRTILNQVIEAEKKAQANMISRREETAATRNLLNTAKLLENNPILLHLKELEASERIAEKIGTLSVYGGLDGLMDMLRRVTKAPTTDRPA